MSRARIIGGGGHPELVTLILPKVQALGRVNLCPYCYLKVLVRDLSISVCIEFVKYVLELSVSDTSEAPVLEVEPELFWFDRTRLFDIHVHESLAQGLPLELYFLNNYLF